MSARRSVGTRDWFWIVMFLALGALEALLFVATGSGTLLLLALAMPWFAYFQWVSPDKETWTFTLDLPIGGPR